MLAFKWPREGSFEFSNKSRLYQIASMWSLVNADFTLSFQVLILLLNSGLADIAAVLLLGETLLRLNKAQF